MAIQLPARIALTSAFVAARIAQIAFGGRGSSLFHDLDRVSRRSLRPPHGRVCRLDRNAGIGRNSTRCLPDRSDRPLNGFYRPVGGFY